jgi:hypothetical protein
MSSPYTSTSSSPEPPPATKKPKAKQGKKSDASQAAGRGRNEGVDQTWPYKPPSGFVLRDTSSSGEVQGTGEFDWDAVADNSDLELWLIRVPDAVCTIHTTPSQPCNPLTRRYDRLNLEH